MMLFTTISGMTTTDKPEPIREIIQVECMLEGDNILDSGAVLK